MKLNKLEKGTFWGGAIFTSENIMSQLALWCYIKRKAAVYDGFQKRSQVSIVIRCLFIYIYNDITLYNVSLTW